MDLLFFSTASNVEEKTVYFWNQNYTLTQEAKFVFSCKIFNFWNRFNFCIYQNNVFLLGIVWDRAYCLTKLSKCNDRLRNIFWIMGGKIPKYTGGVVWDKKKLS